MGKIQRCGLEYKDRVVIITGGSMGIGKGCARVFCDAGAKVVICARHKGPGKTLVKELTAKGTGMCHFEPCDVSKPKDIKRLISRAIEVFGRIDCLINNAGYHPPHKPIDDFTIEDFTHVLQTNLLSYFIASKYALPYIRKVHGSIINIGSLVGITGQEGSTTYCATKGAISGFTKSLAIEEARHGVRVNAVLPGNIVTESRVKFIASIKDGKKIDRWADSLQIMGRSGTVEEVGQLCLFLAGDSASFLTGIE
ncbi:MAG: SDR family oxidoreductase, partial [Chloroflexi bacterium]|nr:SDR family oxidoreductase [Chloroflexota bacterium]